MLFRSDVDHRGIVGDRQGNRTHHGRPWQALCIWSIEVIEHLAREGHPIASGSAGENVTTTGLDWTTIRSGQRLRIGTALVETTTWAVPCRHNARWFSDGRFERIHHREGPVSRVYATVIEDWFGADSQEVLGQRFPTLPLLARQ